MKLWSLPLLAAALCGCEKPAQAPAGGASLITAFTVTEAVSGAANWKLRARGALMDEKKGLIHFSGPAVQFYEKKELVSEISSLKGELAMHDKSAVLSDEVNVHSVRDGMRLATARLFYSTARNKIWTDLPVTIHKGKTVITGRGFTANPDLSEIEISHQETRLAGK